MYDLPPTTNQPPPINVSEFQRELTAIGGLTDSGFPHLHIAWGQATNGPLASTYEMAGGEHLKYRHHVKKTKLLAFPVYGLDGKVIDYDIYGRDDVLPVDGRIARALEMKEDIGIPRFFIEQALAVDPKEWEFQRYLALMRREHDPGPCPAGALVYEEMYCLATHNGCCDEDGLDERKRRCFGEFRLPNQLDLFALRSVEEKMRKTEGWRGNEGWRNPVLAEHVAKAVRERRVDDALRQEREQTEREYLIASQLKPHSRRLTDEGSGMDWQKYKFVPSNYKKKRKRHATTRNVQ